MMLFWCLFVSSISVAEETQLDVDLVGNLVQGRFTYKTEIKSAPENYSISYPDLNCEGTLIFEERSGDIFFFAETLSGGQCGSKGWVELELKQNGKIEFRWKKNRDSEVEASGVLSGKFTNKTINANNRTSSEELDKSIATQEQKQDYRKVEVTEIAGLLDYLKTNFDGARLDSETLDIISVDLNQPPDGIDEVIVGVNDYSYSCGSRGCEYNVLKKNGNDDFKLIYAMITSDLIPTYGFANGYRNLANSEFDDAIVLKFKNGTYAVSNDTVPTLRKRFVSVQGGDIKQSTVVRSEPVFEKEFVGKCRQGNAWSGFANLHSLDNKNPNGMATYGSCLASELKISFSCTSGASRIKMDTPSVAFQGKDGDTVSIKLKVGRKSFEYLGLGKYQQGLDKVIPQFDFDRTDGFLDALKRGSDIKYSINREQFTAHLKDSRKAIETMLSGCSIPDQLEVNVAGIPTDDNSSTTSFAEVNVYEPAKNQCDQLATSPNDHLAKNKPVPFQELRASTKAAVAACRQILQDGSETSRNLYQLGRALLASENYSEAAELFKRSADSGYPAAMNAYAVLLEHGRGIRKDNDLALKYLRASAEAGNPVAMTNLAIFLRSIGGSQVDGGIDLVESKEWLLKAANLEEPMALARLGWDYGVGDGGVVQDTEKAYQYIDKALEKNEQEAHYFALLVSLADYQKPEIRTKYEKIVRSQNTENRLALVSLQGDVYDEALINRLADIGFRFDRPDEEHIYISQSTFDSDELHAQYIEAQLYSYDSKTRTAAEKYIDWVDNKKPVIAPRKLAVSTMAREKFGEVPLTECDILSSSKYDIFSASEPVLFTNLRTNSLQAVQVCRNLPSNQVSSRSKFQLGRALLAAGEIGEAVKWFSQAATDGYPAAMNTMGVLYDNGLGVDVDLIKAYDYFKAAAEMGTRLPQQTWLCII